MSLEEEEINSMIRIEMSKQFDSSKHPRMNFSVEAHVNFEEKFGRGRWIGTSSSINFLDEMLGCELLSLIHVRLIEDGALKFCHVAREEEASRDRVRLIEDGDGYYVAYKPITLSSILFMFVEMKFIHCHSCVMFAMKSMSMCND